VLLLEQVRDTWARQYVPLPEHEVLVDGLRVRYARKYHEERQSCVEEMDRMIARLRAGWALGDATAQPVHLAVAGRGAGA